MDFGFSEKELAFRAEVEEFLKAELPPGWPERSGHWPGGYGTLELQDPVMLDVAAEFRRKLAQRGWLTISWPKEFGGKAHSYIEQAIFNERMSYYRAPATGIAVGIAGPTILMFGTEDNKRQWIPRIAGGEIEMWLGYSEPDAGSDLAAIRTTAVAEGDEFVINGQKVWSTIAHLADYAWLIAKTDPDAHRHHSVSLFIVDNHSPGVAIRPLINIVGVHSFNEVFFDNVRVPRQNMIGELNMGFYYLMTALDFERLMVDIGGLKRFFEELVGYVQHTERDGAPLGQRPEVRRQLAEIATKIEIAYLFFWRTAEMLDKGQVPSVESSVLKLTTTELSRHLADVTMDILGPYGLLESGSQWTPLRGMAPRGYLDCVSATIGAGTSEIQRSIIATRGLGLPRK
jgi:3-oxocholest-4-en-26-oyl-CoA dehydrogenase alpha subunit